MSALFSVIIVSRRRRDSLGLTLTSLSAQVYAPFEVIVVGDDDAEDAIAGHVQGGRVVFVPFDTPNIALARNRGLTAAQGDYVAFIDDDAVAEPFWLAGLAQGLAQPGVVAAGGFVRGRDGVRYQWRGEIVDRTGRHIPLSLPDDQIILRGGTSAGVPEVMGTNCAYDLDALRTIGGFDPAFAYYLDETDVNIRLAAGGGMVAFVPWAQVHHQLAPSDRRAAQAVPSDLTDLGRSLKYFLDKYAPDIPHEDALRDARQTQRQRLIRHMVAGRMDPLAVWRCMAQFDRGLREGRSPGGRSSVALDRSTVRLFKAESPPPSGVLVQGAVTKRAPLLAEAIQRAKVGEIVTLALRDPSQRKQSVLFLPEGVWVHRMPLCDDPGALPIAYELIRPMRSAL